MKRWFSSVAASGCVLLVIAGCHKSGDRRHEAGVSKVKETKIAAARHEDAVKPVVAAAAPVATSVPSPAPTIAPAPKREGPLPQIKFETTTVNLGDIKPESKNIANYTFTNVGKGALNIIDIVKTCGCTVPELVKREYAPGESGTIKVEYQSTKAGGSVLKHLFVMSNDPNNPKQEITLKANVVLQVMAEPQTMQLSLEAPDANVPVITIYSKDNKAFTIKSIESSNNTITAQIDPNASAAKFVIHLMVDRKKLKANLNGSVKFNITHPDIDAVTITYAAMAEFETQPLAIIIRNAMPLKTEERELWVKNNYNKPFEIESITSKNGYIKVVTQETLNNLYKVKLAITPPEVGKAMFFSDVVTVRIKNSNPLEVNCRGFYRR